MKQQCSYRYPTSSCMNTSSETRYCIGRTDKQIYPVYRCKSHPYQQTTYESEADAIAALVEERLTNVPT